eukprot:4738777-Pyramimonas_sp.AAC.1
MASRTPGSSRVTKKLFKGSGTPSSPVCISNTESTPLTANVVRKSEHSTYERPSKLQKLVIGGEVMNEDIMYSTRWGTGNRALEAPSN